MKFAKQLEEELVPEWRAKYLDYKAGKKKLKAITRAIQKSNRNPRHPSFLQPDTPSGDQPATPSHGRRRSSTGLGSLKKHDVNDWAHVAPSTPARTSSRPATGPRSTPKSRSERQPLRSPGNRFSGNIGTYGSIVASPREHHEAQASVASLELPDPALDPEDGFLPARKDDNHTSDENQIPSSVISPRTVVEPTPSDTVHGTIPDRKPSMMSKGSFHGSRGNSSSAPPPTRTSALFKRVFSYTGEPPEKRGPGDQSVTEVDRRQDEFFAFLDSELSKIETFYKMKEEEATERLKTLRQQLHIMRDQRTQQVLGAKMFTQNGTNQPQNGGFGQFNGLRLKEALISRARFGKNSEALAEMTNPDNSQSQRRDSVISQRDYARRPGDESPHQEVPYRSAKRKLKHALQEFYRGVELLKAYAYLNRTAFRKINKKYDKVVNARPTMRYMSEKVNKAWFVHSEVAENLMASVEDLYARYFERGNRKIAASKLRLTTKKSGDYSHNTFRSGLLLMAGLLFAIQSLVYAAQHLDHADPTVRVHTSYLLQIYGGYFLVVFHFLLFCVVCMIWTATKINYTFIFEFDTRHALEWRQLLEFPSAFFFMLGLFMWLNFLSINAMYIYWPVVLVGLTLIVLFLPARVLFYRSRLWWAYSNWRLMLAGFYPVEFRDFFLGDMYCSQTYAMGNIELFFCLYAKHWNDPPQCNSSHSRLLGFFQCLPAIWRAFQCLRRFSDTKNVFPHLLNFGKYIFSVLYYMTLSLYRIDRVEHYQATFITFALLNAVYVSVWDLIMDWSLGNPYAKNPLLRDVLAFRRPWVYYIAMVLDVVVRFNWIFYAIFAHDIQHSAVLSFMVSFSEICRRGMWTIFRVENEHCTNVLLFRASRDVPLPYDVQAPETESGNPPEDLPLQDQQWRTPYLGPSELEQGTPPTPGTSARTRGQMSRVGTIVASAHVQDFQRKKPLDQMPVSTVQTSTEQSPDDTSEEEEEEEEGDSAGSRFDTDDDFIPGANHRRFSQIRISEESDHPPRSD